MFTKRWIGVIGGLCVTLVAFGVAGKEPGFVDKLRARLNVSGIRVRADLPSIPPVLRRTDVGELARVLAYGDGSSVTAVIPTGNRAIFKVGHKQVDVDVSTGKIDISDDRSTEKFIGPPVSPDDVSNRALPVLAALGVTRDQSVSKIRQLMRTTITPSEGTRQSESIAYKIDVRRIIGGYSVVNDRIVVTYDLDGTLRKIRGRWTPVDFEGSRLAVGLSAVGVAERALVAADEAATKWDLALRPDEEVRVYTRLRPILAKGVFTLQPEGRIELPVSGLDGAEVFNGVDFPL